ncbi:MAG: molybdopterin dinucleotide binding domain-containing protein, partial [Dehalococcoidales bacterium]|nr:molybdopterin dinucleotide binding domain-containing protein [Dehalococcoidales bacterium]
VRLEQKEYWPENLEKMIDRFLEPTGLTFQQTLDKGERYVALPRRYNKHGELGFATHSGKVELTPSIFEMLGYDPLPTYEEPMQSPERTPELAKEFPLILISGSRNRHYVHSTLRQIERLRRRVPYPVVQIHPQTAHRLGINDGDWVYIETTEGRIRQKAELSDVVSPQVVHAAGYWWFPEKPAGEPSLFGVWESNINAIIPDQPDMCSFSVDQFFRGPLCKVYKAGS